MKDYVIDQNDKHLVSGNMYATEVKNYLLTYMRNKHLRTIPQDQEQVIKCPNCGAPIDIKNSKVCEYCHTIIHSEQYGWFLYNIEIPGKNEKFDNRGVIIEDNSDVRFTKQSSPYYTGYYDNGIEDKFRDPFEDDDYNKTFNK